MTCCKTIFTLSFSFLIGTCAMDAQVTLVSHFSFAGFGGGSSAPGGENANALLVGTNSRADDLPYYEESSSRDVVFGATQLSGSVRNSTRVISDTNFVRIIFSAVTSLHAVGPSPPPSYSSEINSHVRTSVRIEGFETSFRAIIRSLTPHDGETTGGVIGAYWVNPTNIFAGDGRTFDSVGEFTGWFENHGRLEMNFDVVATAGVGQFNSFMQRQAVADAEIILGDVIPGESQHVPIFPDHPATNRQGAPVGGVFIDVRDGSWIDPEIAFGYRFDFLSNSLCTKILSFPQGMDADEKFKVSVGTTVLGEFWQTNSVDFVQLVGVPVSSFRITGINPLVDARLVDAFPIQLQFATNTASLVMMPIVNAPLKASVQGSSLILSWPSEENIWYDVYESTNSTSWAKIANRIAGTDETLSLSFSTEGPTRFFKLAVLDE